MTPHPVMSGEDIRVHAQVVWDNFYSVKEAWRRSAVLKSLKSRLAFLLVSKLYRQMFANTGLSTDSARVSRSTQWARLMAKARPPALRRRAHARSAGAGAVVGNRPRCYTR